LSGTWQTNKTFADEVEVRTLLVRQDEQIGALSVADLALMWPSASAQLRESTAAALGIPSENVGLFVTQNHVNPGAPHYHGVVDMARLERAFVQAAKEAAAALQPAEVAHVNARPDPPLTFRRRVPMGDMGEFTCYYGFLVDEKGRANCSPVIRAALAGLAGGQAFPINAVEFDNEGRPEQPEAAMPVPDPLHLPRAADELVQGLFFRSPGGKPIGCLIRFASHPNTYGAAGDSQHSGDYPAYVRRRAEQAFGGMGVFLTGPCGDQVCPIRRKSLQLAESIGRQVADAVLGRLAGASWQRDAVVRAASPEVRLRVREDYPESRVAARKEWDEIKAAFPEAARAGASLAELKRMSDRYEFLLWVANTGDSHRDWTGLEVTGRAGQEVSHPLFLLQIGPSVIAGLPGEPFGGYSARLRAETIGEALITAEEANGYLSYFPMAEDYPRGGYEVTAALFGPDSEEALVGAAGRAVLKSVGKTGAND